MTEITSLSGNPFSLSHESTMNGEADGPVMPAAAASIGASAPNIRHSSGSLRHFIRMDGLSNIPQFNGMESIQTPLRRGKRFFQKPLAPPPRRVKFALPNENRAQRRAPTQKTVCRSTPATFFRPDLCLWKSSAPCAAPPRAVVAMSFSASTGAPVLNRHRPPALFIFTKHSPPLCSRHAIGARLSETKSGTLCRRVLRLPALCQRFCPAAAQGGCARLRRLAGGSLPTNWLGSASSSDGRPSDCPGPNAARKRKTRPAERREKIPPAFFNLRPL